MQLIIVLKKVTFHQSISRGSYRRSPLTYVMISRHYATAKYAICALWKYSAWQFQSAVHYIRTLLLKMPFEISDLCHLSIMEFLFERPSFRFQDAKSLVNYSINCCVKKETHDSIFEQIYEIFPFSFVLKSCT